MTDLHKLRELASKAAVWNEPWTWNGEFPIQLVDAEGFKLGGAMLPSNEPLAAFWSAMAPSTVLALVDVAEKARKAERILQQAAVDAESKGQLMEWAILMEETSAALRTSLAALGEQGK